MDPASEASGVLPNLYYFQPPPSAFKSAKKTTTFERRAKRALKSAPLSLERSKRSSNILFASLELITVNRELEDSSQDGGREEEMKHRRKIGIYIIIRQFNALIT